MSEPTLVVPGRREETHEKAPGARDIEVIPEKKKLVTSADDMGKWYRDEDGNLTEFGKNTIEPQIETSKAMAEGMEDPLGHGPNAIMDSIDTSNIRNAISEAVPIPTNTTESEEPKSAESAIENANEEASEIEEDESAPIEDKKAVKRYSDATMSIQDAFANGLIDKNTRDYLIIDAVATFAKNLGRNIGNIGAQFSGGTIDNTVDESKWNSRQAAKWNQEQQMELEDTINSPEWRQREAELKSLTSDELNNQIKQVQANYSEAQIQQTLKNLAQQYDLGELNKEIMNGKVSAGRLFQEMMNNSDSKLGQLAFGLLTTLSYGGGGGLTSAAGSVLKGVGSFLL